MHAGAAAELLLERRGYVLLQNGESRDVAHGAVGTLHGETFVRLDRAVGEYRRLRRDGAQTLQHRPSARGRHDREEDGARRLADAIGHGPERDTVVGVW